MVFSSLFFLYIFFPLNILLYYSSKSIFFRNIVLLLFSLFFYAWGEPLWVFVLMCSVGIDYLNGLFIEKNRGKAGAKFFLAISVFTNLSLLVLFKYSGMIVDGLNLILPFKLTAPNLIMPIGISFYSFQSISYVIDVYRGDVSAQKSYYKVLLYVSLYPQLVAGPIVRYPDVAAEIEKRTVNSLSLIHILTG